MASIGSGVFDKLVDYVIAEALGLLSDQQERETIDISKQGESTHG